MQEWIHWCHHRLDPLSQRHFPAFLYRRLPLDRDRLFSLLRRFSETLRVFRELAFRSRLQSEPTLCIMAKPLASVGRISLILDVGFLLESSRVSSIFFPSTRFWIVVWQWVQLAIQSVTHSNKYIACIEAVVILMLDFRSPSHWKPEKRSTTWTVRAWVRIYEIQPRCLYDYRIASNYICAKFW